MCILNRLNQKILTPLAFWQLSSYAENSTNKLQILSREFRKFVDDFGTQMHVYQKEQQILHTSNKLFFTLIYIVHAHISPHEAPFRTMFNGEKQDNTREQCYAMPVQFSQSHCCRTKWTQCATVPCGLSKIFKVFKWNFLEDTRGKQVVSVSISEKVWNYSICVVILSSCSMPASCTNIRKKYDTLVFTSESSPWTVFNLNYFHWGIRLCLILFLKHF